MKVAGKYEIPDGCPVDCSLRPEFFDQGCMCTRCPVLICRKHHDDTEGYTPLVEPDSYRPDWAAEWVRFFAGEVEFPELPLRMED